MPSNPNTTISNADPSVKAEPVLAPPGAGIPFIHRMAGRYVFAGIVAKRASWDSCDVAFTHIGNKIIERCNTLSATQLRERVLVPPMLMLEDSSRYWSVAMTLEHLMIVSRGMAQVIAALSHGKLDRPLPIADVANFKPRLIDSDTAAFAVRDEFKQFVQTHITELNRAVIDRRSSVTHAHPWFGELTAWQWHWVMARHLAVHYGQIRTILGELKK